MVKRILSIGIIIIIGATSLVASCLHHQESKKPYVMYQESRQLKKEIYHNAVELELTNLVVPSSELHMEDKVVTANMVSDIPVAGVFVVNLNIKEKKDTKKIKLKENRWDIELTKDEIELMAKILWVESRGESNKGQRAVVEVILNRMNHWAFEGTVKEVLSMKGQFTSWKSRNSAEPTEKEYDNIQKVLNGETDITTLNTVYFSTSARNDKLVDHIGGHYFCEYEYESREEQNKN
jgi:spore germination cell wall hydrolase CwlJ-like protein